MSAPVWQEHMDAEYEGHLHNFFPTFEGCQPPSDHFTSGDDLVQSHDSDAMANSTEFLPTTVGRCG